MTADPYGPVQPMTDVSEHNYPIDWAKMKAAGIDLCFIRLVHGATVDKRCEEYAPAAARAGVALGGYSFVNPKRTPDGRAGARAMIAEGEKLGIKLFMADVENFVAESPDEGQDYGFRGAKLTAWLQDFVDEMRKHHRPIIYGNAGVWGGLKITANDFPDVYWMIPRYPFYSLTAPQPPADPALWDEYIWPYQPVGPVGVPLGTWDDFQFSAGYNRMGATYGVGSRDIDLNLVRQQAYDEWLKIIVGADLKPAPRPPTINPKGLDMALIIRNTNDVVPNETIWATIDGGYAVGGENAIPDGAFVLDVSAAKWQEYIDISDAKKLVDQALKNGITVTVPPAGASGPVSLEGTFVLHQTT